MNLSNTQMYDNNTCKSEGGTEVAHNGFISYPQFRHFPKI